MPFYRPSFHVSLLLILLLSGCASTEKPALTNNIRPDPGNNRAAQEALQLQGQPYVYGGQSLEEGFDCSGLVVYVYKRQGLRLPRTTQSLARQLPPIQPEQRQPGDLLFFHTDKPFSHVGIYVGDDNFVHAPSSRTGRVMLSSLRQTYWRERFIGVRRPVRIQALSMNDNALGTCGFN
ncbi:MAG: C40 family peptidase [Methylomonas sp.]|nr:C40 family peptidase [Methylomonas sp.]